MTLSDRIRLFFHQVSNVRPIYWICGYVALVPIFALIYWALPDSQFRIPDNSGTDYGSWLYYSIVTISTLGFGDYTPAHGWAQAVTAVEVLCGLSVFGFFLNAVGSMKSEIDVVSEIAKQRALHAASEKEKLVKSTPTVLHNLNIFLSYCFAVTTPMEKRREKITSGEEDYDGAFAFRDMADLYKASGLPGDHSGGPAVDKLLRASSKASLTLDTLQNRVDLSLWPELLEDCFNFVANFQIFSSADTIIGRPPRREGGKAVSRAEYEDEVSRLIGHYELKEGENPSAELAPYLDLYHFIKENGAMAIRIESALTKAVNEKE